LQEKCDLEDLIGVDGEKKKASRSLSRLFMDAKREVWIS